MQKSPRLIKTPGSDADKRAHLMCVLTLVFFLFVATLFSLALFRLISLPGSFAVFCFRILHNFLLNFFSHELRFPLPSMAQVYFIYKALQGERGYEFNEIPDFDG
jgi:sensor histidine kinase YesM